MATTTRLSFEATADLVGRVYAHPDQVRRERIGGMELVSGVIGAGEGQGVALVIDGVTGESVRMI